MKKSSTKDYRNKLIINQRGGSIDINNSTDREEIKISHYSGSNISFNNVVTSELASNNKQTNVIFDEFRTVGHNNSLFVVKDNFLRIGGSSFELKGFMTEEQLLKHEEWKQTYQKIADINGKFYLKRAKDQGQAGTRAENPDLSKNQRQAVLGGFGGYGFIPVVKAEDDTDQVTFYAPIGSANSGLVEVAPGERDILEAFGEEYGTEASGIIEYGARESSSTQDGSWEIEMKKEKPEFPKLMKETLEALVSVEKGLGEGGDEVKSVKRHSIETIGAVINEYPSIRIDDEGRSCVTELGVCDKSVFRHFGELPLVEDVDNTGAFPCGTKTLTVGNKYNVLVGAGGVQIKTTGPITMSGTNVRVAGTTVNIASQKGTTLNSAKYVDIFAPHVMVRSTKQILLDSSVGVAKNLIVSGSIFTEGETYVNHISAPTEVQQTYETKVFGKLVAGKLIGICDPITNAVYAVDTVDTVELEPHSHHFNNIPLTLYDSNATVRRAAILNDINKVSTTDSDVNGFTGSPANPIIHEFKLSNIIRPLEPKK